MQTTTVKNATMIEAHLAYNPYHYVWAAVEAARKSVASGFAGNLKFDPIRRARFPR